MSSFGTEPATRLYIQDVFLPSQAPIRPSYTSPQQNQSTYHYGSFHLDFTEGAKKPAIKNINLLVTPSSVHCSSKGMAGVLGVLKYKNISNQCTNTNEVCSYSVNSFSDVGLLLKILTWLDFPSLPVRRFLYFFFCFSSFKITVILLL